LHLAEVLLKLVAKVSRECPLHVAAESAADATFLQNNVFFFRDKRRGIFSANHVEE
jgi:hypothetical protein